MQDDTVIIPNEFRIRAAKQGLSWLQQGFALFAKQPGMWILLWLAWILLCLMVALLPLGGAVITVIEPIFMAGFLIATVWRQRGEDLDIAYLFAGFKRAGPLATLGAIMLLIKCIFVSAFLMVFTATLGESITAADLEAIAATANNQAEQVKLINKLVATASPEALTSMMGGFFAIMLFYGFVMFGLWFATPLVALARQSPWAAVKLSFAAVMGNWRAFTLYGLCSLTLTFVAMIPFGLGLLVLLPALIPTQYIAYKDVFPDLLDQIDDDESK